MPAAAIFLTLFLLCWAVLGALAWIGLSLRRRAVGALFALPPALLGAIGGGAAAPLLGLDTALGIGVSMITALAGGAALAALAYSVWDLFALGRLFRPLARRPRCTEQGGSIQSQAEQAQAEREPCQHE